ncbi:putative lantibiotic dehydratase [Actinacidiphila reveromycinica]|uniref:Putative lantibiotic dehydratase n=1 Tax=Actinacidiphila reveromycinica TaxID=659352 RepID=A0A7U3UUH4_9ACTN|nr:lantibiotic dehydratase [Streptomyces sp. SN-593]BBA99052.1 putative lantibiotic dehydratase [Streptomyces sp. SN-593]
MTSRASTYTWQGLALLRASTLPGAADVPRTLDLDDPTSTRLWLERVWGRPGVHHALSLASPGLSNAVRTLIGDPTRSARDVRRAASSTVAYLLRWQHRSTPLGLFSGVAPATVGPQVGAQWRDKHPMTVRTDGEWIAAVIKRLHRSPGLLQRLPLLANDVAHVRGGRLVAPGPPSLAFDHTLGPIEISIRNRPPVAATMEAARTPIPYRDLHARLRTQFPRAPSEQVHTLLTELVDQQFLLTSLPAPMTTTDALDHLCRALDDVHADEVPDVQETVQALRAIREDLSGRQPTLTTDGLDVIASRMTAVTDVTDRPLHVDTALDCDVQIPPAVIDEVTAAVTAAYRTTPQPYGRWAWLDYHNRFRDRYGPGAVVPVPDLVADSGLGLPTGYDGVTRESVPKAHTARDDVLLALVQQALMNGRGELLLTKETVATLEAAAGSDERILAPRVEAGFEIHAPSGAALARGDFRAVLTAMPRPASSLAGRFAHALPSDARKALAATYAGSPEALDAQLVFTPRRARNTNVARTPLLLPRVLEISGWKHTDGGSGVPGESVLPLTEIGVTADARTLRLVHLPTGRTIHLQVVHALEAGLQTPVLARFLAEVSTARSAVYGLFDFGAASRLPYLPRVRHGRTVLRPARWLLKATDLPGRRATGAQWDAAFDSWRARMAVPDQVAVVDYDQVLPVDLTHPVHRQLVRTQIGDAHELEMRETSCGDAAHGWTGRATEFWISLALPQAPAPRLPAPVRTVAPSDRQLPGGNALHARIHADPLRFADILTRHLSRLLTTLDDRAPTWWFSRRRELSHADADQQLTLTLHPRPGTHAEVLEVFNAWAAELYSLGLSSGFALVPYQPQTGRWGYDEAMDAAHRLFAEDSTATLAQLTFADRNRLSPQALAAASAFHLASRLAPCPDDGFQRLVADLPRSTGPLDRKVRDQALHLADSAAGPLADLPGGERVVAAWQSRADAADAYRHALAGQRDPFTAARSLIHQHHLRAVNTDPMSEAVTVRLVRAAALRNLRTTR